MQPLSKVKPDAVTEWGHPTTMTRRPQLAAKVARCIAQWSESETHLGAFLSLLLHANQKAAVAMYSGLENRSAQLRLITSAAKASLPDDHFDVVSVLFSAILRPAMKERDRLAHWARGYSDDALLISEPALTLKNLMHAITAHPGIENAGVPVNYDHIYVVRDGDLDRIIGRSIAAKTHLRMTMAMIWDRNPPAIRVGYLHQLSNVPEIHQGLIRLARDHQKAQASLDGA